MNRVWIQLTCHLHIRSDHVVIAGTAYPTYARRWHYAYIQVQVDLADAIALQLLGLAEPACACGSTSG